MRGKIVTILIRQIVEGVKLAMNKLSLSELLDEKLGFTTNKTVITVRAKMVTISVIANAVLFISTNQY